MDKHAIQYTVRGVPREVDRAIRERAARENKSVNQVIIDELTVAVIGRRKRADFSDLVGCWPPDGALDEILESQRQVDASEWA